MGFLFFEKKKEQIVLLVIPSLVKKPRDGVQ